MNPLYYKPCCKAGEQNLNQSSKLLKAKPCFSVLQGVESVGWYLYLSSNPMLTDVKGLAALRAVNGALTIKDNYKLKSLAGMESLEHVGESVD